MLAGKNRELERQRQRAEEREGLAIEAVTKFRDAVQANPKLKNHPELGYQVDLSASHNNIGYLLRVTGHPDHAQESFSRSAAIQERLVRDNHRYRSIRGILARHCITSLVFEMVQGRWQEARERLERAIVHQRNALAAMPRHPFYQRAFRTHLLDLTKVYQSLKLPDEAIRTAREWWRESQGNPNELHNVSCTVSLTIPLVRGERQEVLAVETVPMLKKAMAAGWSNAQYTSRDPDPIPLRDHGDFRRLLAELFDRGIPDDPFAP